MQEQIEFEARSIEKMLMVFLLVSNPDEGRIDYVHVYENYHDGKPHGCLSADKDGFKPLVTDLKNPSYIHYNYKLHQLNVCDGDSILAYDVVFNTADENMVPDGGYTLVNDVECGGLHADKFGNLLFVDKKRKTINKISTANIKKS